MSPNKLTEFLDELESYLTDYADAEYDASSASGIPNREMSLLGSLEEVRTELKRNAAGIATQCPINKAATQCRFAINKVPPGTKLYTRPPLSQGVPEGYVLAPKSMCITQEDVGLIVMMTGWDDEDQDDAEGVLWFGLIEDDEGNRTHGLNISCSECMEEGAIQLVQFDEPNSTPAAPQADEWVRCSERLPTEAESGPDGCGDAWVTDGKKVWSAPAFRLEETDPYLWMAIDCTRPQPPEQGDDV